MFAIPSLDDLLERARQAFRAYLPGSDAWGWPNNIGPTAKAVAGAVHEVFGFADYIQKQKFALTADRENLDLHGAELGLARKPAAPARGFVRVTASSAVIVHPGAEFRRSDDISYRALVGGSTPGPGTLDVDVVATSDGKNTIAQAGADLAIVAGVTGDALAQVGIQGIAGGADVEADGEPHTMDLGTFRGRILFRKRNPPHGGAPSDYVLWAGSVAGVTRVFVERLWIGAGTVRVFVLMDDLYANGIPPGPEVQRVSDYVQTVAPASAIINVTAPVAKAIDITVTGLKPDTVTVRENVLAELRAGFRRLSRVAGNDTPVVSMPYLATPESFSRSWIWQAVANASGEQRHVITLPAGDTALSGGEIATLGTVTFVP